MRNLILFSTLTLLIVLFVNVESTSPRMCPETCYPCETTNCECGTYKDECNCCDLCMKCKGSSCIVLQGDVCEDGYTCGDPNRSYLEQMHNPATCIPAVKKS
ncbi:uncharacterized protein TNCT_126571 [Trichonephila clavata]|uniref:IGFBP N-terminal domain-containing protein n=1 Tax=Trichonephila clavata TaxID=2740835 RepID=A0A8X6IL93_TRICU|nr:uncharacterized protein TNCT_126571 [Trichonephila clavata]